MDKYMYMYWLTAVVHDVSGDSFGGDIGRDGYFLCLSWNFIRKLLTDQAKYQWGLPNTS